MVKNKSRLAIKLFVIVWVVLAIHIALKLTFSYWQLYVIPNDKLQIISDFIDGNRWIQATLNGVWYLVNGLLMLFAGLQIWWFKNTKQSIIVLTIMILSFLYMIIFGQSDILTLILTFAIPLIINYKKWLYIILTFIFSNIFLALSLWLEGFTTANDMQYAIRMFLQFDYYIMLTLNYFVFNFIKKEK